MAHQILVHSTRFFFCWFFLCFLPSVHQRHVLVPGLSVKSLLFGFCSTRNRNLCHELWEMIQPVVVSQLGKKTVQWHWINSHDHYIWGAERLHLTGRRLQRLEVTPEVVAGTFTDRPRGTWSRRDNVERWINFESSGSRYDILTTHLRSTARLHLRHVDSARLQHKYTHATQIIVIQTYHVHRRELLGQFVPDVISCYSHVCVKKHCDVNSSSDCYSTDADHSLIVVYRGKQTDTGSASVFFTFQIFNSLQKKTLLLHRFYVWMWFSLLPVFFYYIGRSPDFSQRARNVQLLCGRVNSGQSGAACLF